MVRLHAPIVVSATAAAQRRLYLPWGGGPDRGGVTGSVTHDVRSFRVASDAVSRARQGLAAEVLRSPSQWADPTFEAQWKGLCGRHGGLEVLFQSPEWFAHLGRDSSASRRRVIVVRDGDQIVAVGAVHGREMDLPFDVGARHFGGFRLPGLVLLGGEPLAPPTRAVHDAFFTALVGELEEDQCVVMPMLGREAFFRRYVDDWVRANRGFFSYVPETAGHGLTHSLTLSSTFEEYLNVHFNSKQRSHMKRRLKLLDDALGTVRLARYDSPSDVRAFLDGAQAVSRASWQFATVGPHFEASENWDDKLGDLARRGLLRSYILHAGERPVAFVLGYQRSDVFYHVKTGYDRSLSKLAPGIDLLSLILHDLGATGRPQRVNFMFGDTEYKREFANVHVQSDELLLVRRNLRNVLRCGSHAAFRAGVTFARDRVRRLVPLRRATAIVGASPD